MSSRKNFLGFTAARREKKRSKENAKKNRQKKWKESVGVGVRRLSIKSRNGYGPERDVSPRKNKESKQKRKGEVPGGEHLPRRGGARRRRGIKFYWVPGGGKKQG